jgi:hypothetical protein
MGAAPWRSHKFSTAVARLQGLIFRGQAVPPQMVECAGAARYKVFVLHYFLQKIQHCSTTCMACTYKPMDRVIRAMRHVVLWSPLHNLSKEYFSEKILYRTAQAHSTICAGMPPLRNINPCSQATAVENLKLRQGAASHKKGQNRHCAGSALAPIMRCLLHEHALRGMLPTLLDLFPR